MRERLSLLARRLPKPLTPHTLHLLKTLINKNLPTHIHTNITFFDTQVRTALENATASTKSALTRAAATTKSAIGKTESVINRATGYDRIESLKSRVLSSESNYAEARSALLASKGAYEQTIARRSECQREINALLQRKHAWAPDDVNRFTELYRSEHVLEQGEIEARQALKSAEQEVERAHEGLMASIRERYHEEQLWSDKIRGFSAYGTLGLVAANAIMFVMVQSVLEPRRRRKMVDRIEEFVRVEGTREMEDVAERVAGLGASVGGRLEEALEKARDQEVLLRDLKVQVSALGARLLEREEAGMSMSAEIPPVSYPVDSGENERGGEIERDGESERGTEIERDGESERVVGGSMGEYAAVVVPSVIVGGVLVLAFEFLFSRR